MNRTFLVYLTAILSITLLMSAPSFAEDTASQSPLALPIGTLDSSQISPLFSGNTAHATIEGKDKELVFFFGSDGQLTKVQDGFQETGAWNVRDDGRLCTVLESSGRDCRIIVKHGDQYQQYAVKLDGDHRYEMTYDVFQKGEHLSSMSKDPLLPLGTLSKEEVVDLFSGQTVESVTAVKGRVSQTYYNPDGTIEQIQAGKVRFGKWRVRNDARICLQMENLEEKCRIIVKEDGDIRKYIVKKNGQHQHSVSYRKFTQGKSF